MREGVARGEIKVETADWSRIMAGRYMRPPRYSTDKFKDAQTVNEQLSAGRSKTYAYGDVGWDYEDEVEQSVRDEEFEKAQGLGTDEPKDPPTASANDQPPAPAPKSASSPPCPSTPGCPTAASIR